MVIWLRELLGLGVAEQWVVASLLSGLGLLVGVSLFRAVYTIRHYGFLNYLKSAFRIESETWRLIGILLLLAMAAAMVFTQHV